MNGVAVVRIGRELTPAEDTLALARECDEFADYVARNLCHASGGGRWAELSDTERDGWIREAIDLLKVQLSEDPDPPFPGPPSGGGESLAGAA